MTFPALTRPWLAQTIRLTTFSASAWVPPANIWEAVLNEPPEVDQGQPRDRIRVQSGPWEDYILQVSATPFRVDWAATPRQGEDRLLVADLMPKFMATTGGWLATNPMEIKRLAFAVHGLLAEDDRVSGYNLLKDLIPSVREVDGRNTSDFLYQINRPLDSLVVPGLKLNRLTKWGYLRFQLAQLTLGISETSIIESTPVRFENFVSLETDDNTDAERENALKTEDLGAIYDELARMAWENLEHGERPK
jgi:hypothetical protein